MITGIIWLDILLAFVGLLVFNLTLSFWFSVWRYFLLPPEDYKGMVEHSLGKQIVKEYRELRKPYESK